MQNKQLNISVIVPTFNEEDTIQQCLEALRTQPFVGEILVVDNNSTDRTMAIVSRFKNVQVLNESRQGQVFARHAGFNAASLSIVATVDADTIVRSNWSQIIKREFENQSVGALSAFVGTHDESTGRLDPLAHTIFNWFEFSVSYFIAGHSFLYGSNMAMRKDAWLEIRDKVALTQAIWEDLQYAILLNDANITIRTVPVLCADISVRRFRDHSLKHVSWYVSGYIRTYRYYDRKAPLARAVLAYGFQVPVVAFLRTTLILRAWSRKRALLLSARLEEQFTRLR